MNKKMITIRHNLAAWADMLRKKLERIAIFVPEDVRKEIRNNLEFQIKQLRDHSIVMREHDIETINQVLEHRGEQLNHFLGS